MSTLAIERASSLGVRLRARPPLVLLTGGKGGVGKTTLCANLGLALQRRGLSVLLVDLDLGLANLNVLLKLAPSCTLEDFVRGDVTLEQVLQNAPWHARAARQLGSADMAVPDPARRERLCAALAELALRYDVVLAQRRGHRARRAALRRTRATGVDRHQRRTGGADRRVRTGQGSRCSLERARP